MGQGQGNGKEKIVSPVSVYFEKECSPAFGGAAFLVCKAKSRNCGKGD